MNLLALLIIGLFFEGTLFLYTCFPVEYLWSAGFHFTSSKCPIKPLFAPMTGWQSYYRMIQFQCTIQFFFITWHLILIFIGLLNYTFSPALFFVLHAHPCLSASTSEYLPSHRSLHRRALSTSRYSISCRGLGGLFLYIYQNRDDCYWSI